MIEVQNLQKTFRVHKRQPGMKAALKSMFHREYDHVAALDGVSFSVGAGEIVGYIGPNGAGKSTSIKVMSGILVPDGGSCKVMDYTPWLERRRYVSHIGVVFGQRTQLWWDVPVIDSYELLRDIYKIPPKAYRDTLALLCHALDIEGLLHTPLRQLSLGQRMRVEIAASLLHSPDILFLDEPTIGLDAVSKLAVRKFIKEINAQRGVTVLLTTHDMHDIEALTDRIILIGRGRILHDGSMEAVRRRFDTWRTLDVTYEGDAPPPDLPQARLLSRDAGRASYCVDTRLTSVSTVVNTLSQTLALTDMTSQGTPLEEIIASLYEEYAI